ncbi:hypothetical protein GUJ93_ZPchr0008g13052 [Zizania palustris]|uniref:Uncharacterized protein n=1 Tax=Zizania palustris TaxID=103762 RepID=A0A8J5V1F6_ZIZPA|nr:hypothetical protein GUJ93_ZPchr0008g13052 [Zizania palustris]
MRKEEQELPTRDMDEVLGDTEQITTARFMSSGDSKFLVIDEKHDYCGVRPVPRSLLSSPPLTEIPARASHPAVAGGDEALETIVEKVWGQSSHPGLDLARERKGLLTN